MLAPRRRDPGPVTCPKSVVPLVENNHAKYFRKNGWEVEGNRLETTVLFPKQSSTRYRFNSDVWVLTGDQKKQPIADRFAPFCHCVPCVVRACIRSFLAPTCCRQAPFSWWDPSLPSLSMPKPVEDLSGSDPDVITIQLIVAEIGFDMSWWYLMFILLRSEAEGGQETVMFQIWHCHGVRAPENEPLSLHFSFSLRRLCPWRIQSQRLSRLAQGYSGVDCFKFWWLLQAVKRPAKKPPKAGL